MCMQWVIVSVESGVGSSVIGGVGSIRQVRLDEVDQDSDSEGSVDSLDSEDSDGEQNINFFCFGKNYKVRGKILICDFYSFFCKIECNCIVEKVNEVIDFVMGKGYLNLFEGKFYVFIKFRFKDVNLY